MQHKSAAGGDSLYRQVADKIESLILSGALRGGDRVPSVRRASGQHGVSVATVVQAYLTLEDRGLIEARPKSGFFVRARVRAQVPEPMVSRPSRAATIVEVGSLQARIFNAARLPEVVPFGAAYPGEENLPVVRLNRIMAAVARSAGPRSAERRMLARFACPPGPTASPPQSPARPGFRWCDPSLRLPE